jgi:hypothetical protein
MVDCLGFALKSNKFRLVSVLLVATFIAVAGCSYVTFRANAQTVQFFRVQLQQRHVNGACVNTGVIMVDNAGYNFGTTVMLARGTHSVGLANPSGCEFVKWEFEGGVDMGAPASAGAVQTFVMYVTGDGVLRQVNQGTSCCGVGGVAVPTNTLAVLAPYLALIGLVATAGVAVKKRKT